MPNDPNHHGERIARLETEFVNLVMRINHLDECIDQAKTQAASNFGELRNKLQQWDTRWKIGLGVILGMMIVSGSGTISLKAFLDLLSKFR